jgi:hypothetical protein
MDDIWDNVPEDVPDLLKQVNEILIAGRIEK